MRIIEKGGKSVGKGYLRVPVEVESFTKVALLEWAAELGVDMTNFTEQHAFGKATFIFRISGPTKAVKSYKHRIQVARMELNGLG